MEFHRPQDAWWLCTACWSLYCCSFTAADHQPGLVRACRAPSRHLCTWGQFWVVRAGKHNSHLGFALLVLPPSLLESLSSQLLWSGMLEMWKPRLLPEKNLLYVLKRWNHIYIWSNLWYKKALKQGNGTHQKHIQSPMRIFCLSRPRNQAQINQLWLSRIFLIQLFRWLGRIGKSLKGKKGQKRILL